MRCRLVKKYPGAGNVFAFDRLLNHCEQVPDRHRQLSTPAVQEGVDLLGGRHSTRGIMSRCPPGLIRGII